ncbi:MAG: hypothetical protein KGV57_05120 [Fusobacterium sp.]|nr:hypothetical protein [Fusobacterium sp.]
MNFYFPFKDKLRQTKKLNYNLGCRGDSPDHKGEQSIRSWRAKKEKGFILFSVVVISFLIISLVFLIQIFVNSRVEIYKSNLEQSKIISEKYFLEEIIKKELDLIESEIKNKNISYAYEYFSINKDEKKEIFKIDKYSNRISYGGYRLYEDREKFNYKSYLQSRLERIYIKKFPVDYIKEIYFQGKIIELRARIKYSFTSKEVDDLGSPELQRIKIRIKE